MLCAQGFRRLRALFPAFVLLLILVGSAARAAELVGDTDVPFSADRTVVTGGKSYTGRVYAVPGKQRHEQNVNGMNFVTILRADRRLDWFVLADFKVYTTFPFPDVVNDYASRSQLGAPVGHDVIAGLPADKFHIKRRGKDGTAVDGDLWMAHDGIVLRMAGVYTAPNSHQTRASYELSNIQIGPQPESLFELPPGVQQLPPEAVAGLLNMRIKH